MKDPITLAFVTLGFFRAGAGEHLTEDEATRFDGEIGAVAACMRVVELIQRAEAVAIAKGLPYVDVFAYRVAEPMGNALRMGHDDNAMRGAIANECAAFFANDDAEALVDLSTAMRKALGHRG